MRTKDRDTITGFLAGALMVVALVIAMDAGATGYGGNDDVTATAEADAIATAEAEAAAAAEAAAQAQSDATGGSATSSNDGVQVGGDTSNVENNSSTVVLVPNNNTESCVRVFGLAFGKDGSSGALGVPWRSAACDFEQAADDAFAAGERELGWFWKCKNKNLYKGFRLDGMSKDEAMHQCHVKAVGYVTAMKTIDELRSQLEFVENEREIERAKCRESTNRISKAWQESCATK